MLSFKGLFPVLRICAILGIEIDNTETRIQWITHRAHNNTGVGTWI